MVRDWLELREKVRNVVVNALKKLFWFHLFDFSNNNVEYKVRAYMDFN